jgi:hypothetical protein
MQKGFGVEEGEESKEGFEETRGGILPVLKLLCCSLEGLWVEGRDCVYLWDATKLDEALDAGSVDIIHVDPPYYDQHDYSGITEFFWVVIQQALLPVLDQLFPGDRVKIDWSPYDPEIPRQLEVRGPPPKEVGALSAFGEKMKRFLEAAARVLKPDGLLVMWYAYGKLQGWEELFYRFYESGYRVTKTWQVWSEARQRFIASLTKAFLTSIVIVARPNAERVPLLRADDPQLEETTRTFVKSSLDAVLGVYGLEQLQPALVTALADGFAAATGFRLIGYDEKLGGPTVFRMLSNASLRVAVEAILEHLAQYAGAPAFSVGALEDVSRLYLFLLLAATPDLRASYDFANRVAQALRAHAAALNAVSLKGERGGVILLRRPSEISTNLKLGRAVAFALKLSELAERAGVRVAEEAVKETDRETVALACYLVALCWEKMGLSEEKRNLLVKVLGGMP